MPTERQKWITRQDLAAHPERYYLFGDNEIRQGFGGQAKEMRGALNSIGVATIKAPGVFWTSEDHKRQCAVIDRDLQQAFDLVKAGMTVVIPADGLGTGLAQLEERSPETFRYLQAKLVELEALS